VSILFEHIFPEAVRKDAAGSSSCQADHLAEFVDLHLDLDLESFERLRYTVARALSLTRQYRV
jgi:hypothetical protein